MARFLTLAVIALFACGAPAPPPAITPRSTQPVVAVTPPSSAALEEARRKPPPARTVSDIGTLLPPRIEGGWAGEPIRRLPPLSVPAPWHGIGIRYYLSAEPREATKVIATYLVWNDRTGEGLILNPIASDAAFVVETAKAQAGVHWLHVMDTYTEFKATTPLPGADEVRWEKAMEFNGGQILHFRDADRTYREKGELFDAAGVASALGATPVTRGFKEPEMTKAGKLLVFRTNLDAPHWSFLEVQWGPFRFDGNWDGD